MDVTTDIQIGNDGYLTPVTLDNTNNESHIYSETITEELANTTENMPFPNKQKTFRFRHCIFSVILAVILTSAVTTAIMMMMHLHTERTCHSESNLLNRTCETVTCNFSYFAEDRQFSFLQSSCPSGWTKIQDSCYNVYDDSKTWFRARCFCQDLNADLISIHSDEEATSLIKHLKNRKHYWIGLNDLQRETKFTWSDGSNVDFTQWDKGQPDNYKGLEHCTGMFKDSSILLRWNDRPCDLNQRFICKMKITNKCGKGDWLLYDSWCYLFVNKIIHWTDARARCRELQSDLVSIDSMKELNFAYRQASVRIDGEPWIGLHKYKGNKQYIWSDGRIEYKNSLSWTRGHPIDDRDCGFLNSYSLLQSIACVYPLYGYICEKKII